MPEVAAWFYARVPTLIFDVAGTLAHVNLAGREIFGSDIAGCQGRHWTDIQPRFVAKTSGPLLLWSGSVAEYHRVSENAEALRLSSHRCHYDSPALGVVALSVHEIPFIDPCSGACSGLLVSLELDEPGARATFDGILDRASNHALMWDVYSASYDRVLPALPFYAEVVQRHCTAMDVDGIVDILDIGAGTGNVTVRLLENGKHVTAIDINPAMLDRLQGKLRSTPCEVTVIHDSAEAMPQFADDRFDGVTAMLTFFDMSDPHAALQEAIRVLRPGGTFIATEPRDTFDASALMRTAERELEERGLLAEFGEDWRHLQAVAPLLTQHLGDGAPRGPHPGRAAAWSAERLLGALRREQFVGLTFRESHFGQCATVAGRKGPDHKPRGA